MSDYNAVTEAMKAGTPPELICAACPWDRLCITPPSMSRADIEKQINEAKQQDADKQAMSGERGLPVGMLLTTLMFAGKDTAAQLCPVFSLKLKSPEGRQVADSIRNAMRGE